MGKDSRARRERRAEKFGGFNVPHHAIWQKHGGNQECNICKTVTTLTKEHTPPRGCLLHADSLNLSVRPRFNPEARPVFTQTGIRHVTTCRRCNGEWLSVYDNYLKQFCVNVDKFWTALNTGGAPELHVLCDVNAVMKSVLGHVLAANIYTPNGPEYDEMRRFVDPKQVPFSPRIHVYYYIHEDDGVYLEQSSWYLHGSDFANISVLKWRPVAFIVSSRPLQIGLPPLNDFLTGSNVELPVPIRAKEPFWWENSWQDRTFIRSGYAATDVVAERRKPALTTP